MTGWSSNEPKLQDETADILVGLQHMITDDSKQARERIKKEFTELKQKVSQLENEKLEIIGQLENDKTAAITVIRNEHDGVKMAQQYTGKNNPDITKKFRDIESNLNRLRNSMGSQKIHIEIQSDNFTEFLKHFCTVSYGPPQEKQDIPPPNIIPPKRQPQQTVDISKPKLQEKTFDDTRAKSPMLSGNALDNFIRFVRTSKSTLPMPTLESEIPYGIVVEAKKYCVANSKYNVNYYEIILNNLKESRLLRNIRTGIENLLKLVFRFYMDKKNEVNNVIKTDSLFYREGVLKNISHFETILRILGYEYKGQLWQLNIASFNDPSYDAKIERLFCEMCVLTQELIQTDRDVQPQEMQEYFMLLINKSVVHNLPMPAAAKIAAKTASFEENTEVRPKSTQPDDDEKQFAFSDLLVEVDSLKTQDDKYITSLNEAKPDPFSEFANKCVNLPIENKYQQIQMYELIHTNLFGHKNIQEIMQGLVGAFKYSFCLFFNSESPEIATLSYEEEPFKSMVASKILNSEQIFLKLGYHLLPDEKGMQLDLARCDKNHEQTVLHIICEILIAIQELYAFPKTGQDPMAYFNPNRHNVPGGNIACPVVQERTVKTAEHTLDHVSPQKPILSASVPNFPPNQSQNVSQQMQSNTGQQFKPAPPRRSSNQVITGAPTERPGSGKVQNIPNQGTGQMPDLPPPVSGHSQHYLQNIPSLHNPGFSQNIPPPQNAGLSQNILPPQNAGISQNILPPQNAGISQNIPPPQNAGLSQNILPPQNTGLSQNIPLPQNPGLSHNILPKNTGLSHNIPPPQNSGLSQNILTQNTGLSQNIPQNQPPHQNPNQPQNYPQYLGTQAIPPPNIGRSQNTFPPPDAGYSQNTSPQIHGQSQNTGQPTGPILYQSLLPQNPSMPPPGQLQQIQGKHPAYVLGLTFKKEFENIQVFSLSSPVPNALFEAAHACVPLSAKDKYSSFVICDVIINSLLNNTLIPDIRLGLEWLSKFCICIYLNIVDTEVRIIQESSGTFGKEIISRLSLSPHLFSILGYEYKQHISCYYLIPETFENEDNRIRLINTCCDCLIAAQDLTEYENIGPQKFIEFFQQFIDSSNSPQQLRQFAGQEGERNPGKPPDLYTTHPMIKQPAEGASAHLGNPQSNPQFSVPVHSQMAHPGQTTQNYSVNPNRDPYGPNILSQYQSAMTYQTNVERQIGNQPERRQISGQQQQQQLQQQPQQPQQPQQQQPQQQQPQQQQPQQQQPQQQQQQQQHGQWQCPHCTSYNSTKYTFCEVCYKSPDFKPDFSDIPRSQSSKQCPYCRHANRMQDVNCVKCGNSMLQRN